MDTQEALSALWNNPKSTYRNAAGVQFYLVEDGPFFITADYPGAEPPAHIALELYQQFDDVDELMALLHIPGSDEVVNIVPEQLMQLYEQGHVNIVCTLKGTEVRELDFTKIEDAIWSKDSDGNIHKVKPPMDQPLDFINYTLGFYRMNRSSV